MDESVRLQTRFLRALDGMAYSTLAAVIVLCHPRLRATYLGHLANYHLIPIAFLCLCTLAIPAPHRDNRRWSEPIIRLKTAALLAAGLAPFVSWWLRSSECLYLLVFGGGAIYSGIWYCLELTDFLDQLFSWCGEKRLAFDARVTRFLVLYFLLIPTLAVYVSFAGAFWMIDGTVFGDLQRTWSLVPLPVRALMVLPVLNTTRLVWMANRVVVANLRSFWPEWS